MIPCDVTCEVNVNLDFVHIFVAGYDIYSDLLFLMVGLEL